MIKYFALFRVSLGSKYITYNNRYIFNKDKSYTQDELNIRIICAFCDTIISILNDIHTNTEILSHLLNNISKVIHHLKLFTVKIANLFGENTSFKQSQSFIDSIFIELLSKDIDKLVILTKKNLKHLDNIIEDFIISFSSFTGLNTDAIINDNLLVCLSIYYMTYFLIKINGQFQKSLFIFQDKEIEESTKAVYLLEDLGVNLLE